MTAADTLSLLDWKRRVFSPLRRRARAGAGDRLEAVARDPRRAVPLAPAVASPRLLPVSSTTTTTRRRASSLSSRMSRRHRRRSRRAGLSAMLFEPFARAHFTLRGEQLALELDWLESYGGGVFLCFRDATSGQESYGGGRYLLDTVKGADSGKAKAGSCSTSTSPTTRPARTTPAGSARWRRRRTDCRSRWRRASGSSGMSELESLRERDLRARPAAARAAEPAARARGRRPRLQGLGRGALDRRRAGGGAAAGARRRERRAPLGARRRVDLRRRARRDEAGGRGRPARTDVARSAAERPRVERLAVVGTGLIGTSVALAAGAGRHPLPRLGRGSGNARAGGALAAIEPRVVARRGGRGRGARRRRSAGRRGSGRRARSARRGRRRTRRHRRRLDEARARARSRTRASSPAIPSRAAPPAGRRAPRPTSSTRRRGS